eukprot:1079102-Amphidinium_carterae.1
MGHVQLHSDHSNVLFHAESVVEHKEPFNKCYGVPTLPCPRKREAKNHPQKGAIHPMRTSTQTNCHMIRLTFKIFFQVDSVSCPGSVLACAYSRAQCDSVFAFKLDHDSQCHAEDQRARCNCVSVVHGRLHSNQGSRMPPVFAPEHLYVST